MEITIQKLIKAVLAPLLVLTLSTQASALVVKTWNGPGTPSVINITPPADDPGWHNMGTGRSSVYLGDQWMLTANHTGVGTIELPGGTYEPIPGQSFTLTNPTAFAGRAIGSSSDLRLFRIKPEETSGLTPEEQDPLVVPHLNIATRTPTTSEELLFIGAGNGRQVNGADANGQFLFGSSYGFFNSATQLRVWGTNKRANPSSLGGVIRSGNHIFIDTIFNDQIGYITRFDRGLNANGDVIIDGSLPDEAQGAGGDSGSPVFFKEDGDWVLSGIMSAIYLSNGQSPGEAHFGNHTAIADLSIDHYRDQIESFRSQSNYSIPGDFDLDGVVTGEIINGNATGDLGMLVGAWMNEHDDANIHSWMLGDANQDGITNLSDFAILRDALGGTISTAAFATLVQASSIPEPSTVALLAACFLLPKWRRR